MKIEKISAIGDCAVLYSASRSGKRDMRYEFIDAVDVGIARTLKWVLMISTQFGCPIGCRMCDAGLMGYKGNLDAAELIAQITEVFFRRPEIDPRDTKKLKVHFARMGEPSLNHAVLDALIFLSRFPGALPSISTIAPRCGVSADFFSALIDVKNRLFSGGHFQLQFSLHSTDAKARDALIPVRKWGFAEIAEFGARWAAPGDRKITLNFALAAEIPFSASVLSKYFDPAVFLVKFTPVHPTERANGNGLTNSWFTPPSRIQRLRTEVERFGFEVIINPAWPEEVVGRVSCGQTAAVSVARTGPGIAS